MYRHYDRTPNSGGFSKYECNTLMKASLFITCIIDQFYPEIGESVLRVLQKLGVDLNFPDGQTCCGQPAFNNGFWHDAQPLAKRFLMEFQNSPAIIVPSGSCASMIRVFYRELLHDDPELLSIASKIEPKVFELSEFIVDVIGIKSLITRAGGSRYKTTYHESCHLRRELGAKTQARTLIKALPSVDLIEMDQAEVCCGFGGIFAVKYSDISGAMLQDKITHISDTGADTVVSCDSGCLMQIEGGLEMQKRSIGTMHLAQLLDKALVD